MGTPEAEASEQAAVDRARERLARGEEEEAAAQAEWEPHLPAFYPPFLRRWIFHLPHHPRSGTPRLEQTTCPNSNSSTPTLRVNEPQNTEWYSSTPCSCDHMKWTTLKTLSSMRRSRLTGSLSPLGWHFSLPEYGAVHWALCAHPIPLGSWRSRPLHRSCLATPASTDARI